MTYRSPLIGVALLILGSLAGCGSSPTSAHTGTQVAAGTTPAAKLTVVKTGFVIQRSFDPKELKDIVAPVALVHNASDQLVHLDTSFVAYGQGGKVLAKRDDEDAFARAGTTVAVVGALSVDGGSKVSRVAATAKPDARLHKDKHPDWTLTVGSLRYRPEYGLATGTVTSKYEKTLKSGYIESFVTTGPAGSSRRP